MPFKKYNANPINDNVIDCVVRAISVVTDRTWDETYMWLSVKGFEMKAPFVSNHVWGAYLKDLGFNRYIIPNTCPDCYTIADFCMDNPIGNFILATQHHVVAVKDGYYYDTSNSGGEIPLYFWKKEA